MLRSRIVIPLSLLSSLASVSALAELTPRACTIAPTSVACEAELERAFTRARNAEINASLAAVNAAQGWRTSSRTHCKSADSTTPRCLAERARELALSLTHCKTADSTTPRCEAERARDFAARRNSRMNTASACQPYNWLTARCDARDVAAVRTGEIVTASACQPYNWLTSGCGAKRSSELALSLTHCKSPNSATPRCMAERANELTLARTSCKTAGSGTPRCEAERAREFADARNAEIDASIAAVAAERIRLLAQSLTHCDSPNSTSPRCEAERAREFAAARNAEIDASMAAVEAERSRAFAAARNAEANASIAAVEAERARIFAAARNAEINASIAAVEAERTRAFAAARNAEINASIAAVEAERARTFAAARNAEINASIAAVDATRNPALAYNLTHCTSANATTPRCEAERARDFTAARNAEINASMAAVEAERTRTFAAARNAEINASMAAAEAQRTLRQALISSRPSQLETGAISLPEHLATAPTVKRNTRHFEPCREAGRITSPLQFTDGSTQIEQDMMPELDRIAMMARSCPAIRIEIHGHSDNSASAKVNRYLAERRAQAAVAYLSGLGIDQNRLAAIGHAETQPLAPNKTAENRARNRRVEIKIHDPAVEAAAQRVMWDLAELLDPTYVPPLARLSP